MEGIRGASEEESGMIPRTVRQIYRSAEKLKEKNWTYEMEGQFLQIYNETIHDLLGNASDFGKMKHEIKHEKNGNTTVTDMTTGKKGLRVILVCDKYFSRSLLYFSGIGLPIQSGKLIEEGKPKSRCWSHQHQ